MALRLDICLMGDRYDAGGGDNPRASEWPPHPARVFAALRSVAAEDELAPLRLLEQLPPPVIHATALAPTYRTRGYVVTNARSNDGGHQSHPGRTSGLRQRSGCFPVDPRVQLLWSQDHTISDSTLNQLDELARRVPYLGRSTSPAMLAFRRVTSAEPLASHQRLEPTARDAAELTLRVPYPGLVEELNALHELRQPAWQATQGQGRQSYRVTRETAPETPLSAASPYEDLVIVRFTDRRPPGNLVSRFTEALRSKVLRDTADPLPPALHGHGYEGRPHVAYLGLPFTGHEHADGHLLGLAIAIPGLDQGERRRILRGLLGPTAGPAERLLVDLWVRGIRGPFQLEYAPDDPKPVGATVARWCDQATSWVSVTPLVLDRFPKKGDFENAVRRCFEQADLPRPRTVELSTHPLTAGGIRLTPSELPRRCQEGKRIYRHVRVTFDAPLAGPVLAGAGRYFGVGLFAPDDDWAKR